MGDLRCQLRDDPGGRTGSACENGATNVGQRRSLLAYSYKYKYLLPVVNVFPLTEKCSLHLLSFEMKKI